MNSLSEFIAVDIETTGLDSNADEIIEIGAARFKNNKLIDTFSRVIKAGIPIPEDITELTGITNELIEHEGGDPIEVVAEFSEYIGEKPLVFHNARFDTSFLKKYIPEIDRSYLDTKIIARILFPYQKSHSLRTLTEQWRIINARPHRGLEDAIAAGELLLKFMAVCLLLPSHLLDKLKLFCSFWGNAGMRDFFAMPEPETGEEKLTAGLTPPGNIPDNAFCSGTGKFSEWPENLSEFFNEKGILERDFSGYELREGQAEMGEDCLESFDNSNFLLVEAGTGTGKSFSYLIPAVLAAMRGEKIFIATRTKNLQEQLLKKDLPFILKYFPGELKVSLLKGRANYLCLLKLYDFSLSTGLVTPADIPNIIHLLSFAEYSRTGDFSEVTSESGGKFDFLSRKFSSSDGFCTAAKCPFYKKCFLFKARKEAQKSSIVIVNHYLFFADLSAETEILADFQVGVFDEAHQLDSVARDYLGIEFSPNSVNFILDIILGDDKKTIGAIDILKAKISKSIFVDRRNERFLEDIDRIKRVRRKISRILRNFFEGVSLNALKSNGRRRSQSAGTGLKVRYGYGDSFQSFIEQASEPVFSELEKFAEDMINLVEIVRMKFDEEQCSSDILEMLKLQAGNLRKNCNSLRELSLAEGNEWVYWFESGRGRKKAGLLASAPLNTGQHMYDRVYSRMQSAIFTSATLRSSSNFENIKFKLGLELIGNESVVEKNYPSPFDYQQLLRVFIIEYAPHPDSSEFPFIASDIFLDFARALRKNMMVLTTSYAQLESFYNLSVPHLSEKGYKVFAQGIDGTAENVAKRFSKSNPAMLIGTDSFWEGVDFPGEELEVLFISRLPFAVPTDPVAQAMGEYLSSLGMDPFKTFSLPEAVIKFRQGCGRLIRSRKDRGVIVILDNRISTKYYGAAFRSTLPVKPIIIKSPQMLQSFLFNSNYERI